MPYADNLYSADDSDVESNAESFSDELSPSDGYFNGHSASLQNVMVPDPSLAAGSTAESKAQEARAEAEANTDPQSPPSPTVASPRHPPSSLHRSLTPATSHQSNPTSPTSRSISSPTFSHRRNDDLYSENTPLLHSPHPLAPPPTYTAATSGPHSPPLSQTFNRNYRTISDHQLEEGRAPSREPESMGRPMDFDEREPLWPKPLIVSPPAWAKLRNLLIILLVLGLGIGFIVTAVKSGESVSTYFCIASVTALLVKNYVSFE